MTQAYLIDADGNSFDLEINIPQALRPAISANMHLLPRLVQAVKYTVQCTFMHKDTKMRQPTQREVKARGELCMECLVQMQDSGLGLIHSIDILPNVVIDALLMATQANPVNDDSDADKNAWSIDADAPTVHPEMNSPDDTLIEGESGVEEFLQ